MAKELRISIMDNGYAFFLSEQDGDLVRVIKRCVFERETVKELRKALEEKGISI